MTRIKICGITSKRDAHLAVEAGADALGFVFSESPRRVSVMQAAEIIRSLPPFVTKVGLFVDAATEAVNEVIERCQIDCIQLHGSESPQYCKEFSKPLIKAFRVKDNESLQNISDYEVAAYLFDAYVKGVFGGTGETFAWQLLAGRNFGAPLILAGGLNPQNVVEAIQTVKPYAVDVSSGVEESPGIKDPDKLWRFIAQVRSVQE